MKTMHVIAWILLIIGGLNWGLSALGYDLATWGFLGEGLLRVIYILVGLSALFELFTHKSHCKHCEGRPAGMGPM